MGYWKNKLIEEQDRRRRFRGIARALEDKEYPKSECCDSKIILTDICSDCKEHTNIKPIEEKEVR